jgi:hypothetical protein
MPLIPAMRPVSVINNTDARPISEPPSKAEIGLNEAMLYIPIWTKAPQTQ